MGRLYLCDYCHKSFKDTATARKNHLKSSQHQEQRRRHYDLFKDSLTLLKEEKDKKPCNWFMRGSCKYGTRCKFSHLTIEAFERLKYQVYMERNARHSQEETTFEAVPSEDSAKVLDVTPNVRPNEETTASREAIDIREDAVVFPLEVQRMAPSLIAAKEQDFISAEFIEWG